MNESGIHRSSVADSVVPSLKKPFRCPVSGAHLNGSISARLRSEGNPWPLFHFQKELVASLENLPCHVFGKPDKPHHLLTDFKINRYLCFLYISYCGKYIQLPQHSQQCLNPLFGHCFPSFSRRKKIGSLYFVQKKDILRGDSNIAVLGLRRGQIVSPEIVSHEKNSWFRHFFLWKSGSRHFLFLKKSLHFFRWKMS